MTHILLLRHSLNDVSLNICKTHRLQIITLGFVLFMCFSVTGCYSQNKANVRKNINKNVINSSDVSLRAIKAEAATPSETRGKQEAISKGIASPPEPALTLSKAKGNVAPRNDSLQKDPYLWDFGKVKEGEVLEHEFIFKNESKVVINIKDINTSCGCTISEVKKKKLLPGEPTIIGVKFNAKGYSGAVTQYVYMNTDVVDNPIVRYIIKAEVGK